MTTSLIEIAGGVIRANGQRIGTVNKDLKHGYHPVARMKVGQVTEDFELDTPDLIERIKAAAAAAHDQKGADR